MSAAQLRHLLHHLAIKHFTVGVFVALDTVAVPSAPLFEEEGGSGMTGTGTCHTRFHQPGYHERTEESGCIVKRPTKPRHKETEAANDFRFLVLSLKQISVTGGQPVTV